MQNKRVELLAPAGNIEGFYGAIHAGADAVYLGGSRFGARAYADNFTEKELVGCIRYAHLWGRRVYLTVNTLVKEVEFGEIYDYLLPYYEAGLDGVIVQDIGVFAYIREHFPGMELHVSTQMTLTGVYGAKLLQDMGACRIVPARELSLKEIHQIKERTGLAIETFVHGAMCYCYSGQCLFSSILGGRSGNRGRCAQPCRLPYEVRVAGKTSGECYPLSLKDMCTIEHIPELIEAGIDSFKIEGRMKKPEYTAGVTAIYRKYIDKYYRKCNISIQENRGGNVKKGFDFHIAPRDMKDLSCLYIRSERQDGYYYKHNAKDMVTLDSPAYSGSDEELLARIRQQYLEHKPKLDIGMYADFTTGQKASITLVLGEISVTVEGDAVQTASRQPITSENIEKQLRKLGDSIFAPQSIEIQASADAFYPLGAINELRREAVRALEDTMLEKNGFPIHREDARTNDSQRQVSSTEGLSRKDSGNVRQTGVDKGNGLIVSLRRIEQLRAVAEACTAKEPSVAGASVDRCACGAAMLSRIYVDGDLLLTDREEALSLSQKLAKNCELVISLPYIIRSKDYSLIEKHMLSVLEQMPGLFSGVQVRSMEAMGMLKSKNYEGKIYADTGFYAWNVRTVQEWSKTSFHDEKQKAGEVCIEGFCMPLELRGGEQRALLASPVPWEKIVYGRIPMMITANCVANTTAGCKKQSGEHLAQLVDRYHKTFPVELNCTHCMNIIYNSAPLSLHGEISKWREQTGMRLDFTVENRQETAEVIRYFGELLSGAAGTKAKQPPYAEYTTGHEKRGVE